MRPTLPIAACALILAVPAAAQTRLIDQHVDGWKRVCSYEDLRPPLPGARGTRSYTMQVGRGEPCPPRYSPPAAQQPRRAHPRQGTGSTPAQG